MDDTVLRMTPCLSQTAQDVRVTFFSTQHNNDTITGLYCAYFRSSQCVVRMTTQVCEKAQNWTYRHAKTFSRLLEQNI